MNVRKFIERARYSAFHLWVLNLGLQRMVPFNKPHDLRVSEIGDHHVKMRIPYKRKNLNHIRGIHACALATLSEYATGFLLLSKLEFDTYRIIMQRLEMEYHYQGKTDAIAEFTLEPEWLRINILDPLSELDSVLVNCQVKIHDLKGNHLTTGNIFWQIKKWSNVKTKLGG